MWVVWMMWALHTSFLYAEECEEKEMLAAWEEKKGDVLVTAFLSLAECSPEKAKRWGVRIIPNIAPTRIGLRAIQRSIVIGLEDIVEIWMLSLLPTERIAFLEQVSDECSEHESMKDFLYRLSQNHRL